MAEAGILPEATAGAAATVAGAAFTEDGVTEAGVVLTDVGVKPATLGVVTVVFARTVDGVLNEPPPQAIRDKDIRIRTVRMNQRFCKTPPQ